MYQDTEENDININNLIDSEINLPITEEEILSATKSLRNNKSCGLDNIANEHLKSTVNSMLPIYVKLFNIIFDTGIIPESWTLGSIKPIYKNKGDPAQPENYRPITLLSCFGKLFISIINTRLTKFSEKVDVINWAQAGFRKKLFNSR